MRRNVRRIWRLRIPSLLGKRLPRRFLANEDGVYAIEFALIAVPFFSLLFMIFEVAFTIFANQLLDNAIADSARLIRTGQAQEQSFDKGKFKTEVCSRLVGFFDCDSHLHVDVRTYSNFSAANSDASPVSESTEEDEEGMLKLSTGDMKYDHGGASEIVVARVYYEWPMITPLTEKLFSNMTSGRRLIASVAAFRNEPFPW